MRRREIRRRILQRLLKLLRRKITVGESIISVQISVRSGKQIARNYVEILVMGMDSLESLQKFVVFGGISYQLGHEDSMCQVKCSKSSISCLICGYGYITKCTISSS